MNESIEIVMPGVGHMLRHGHPWSSVATGDHFIVTQGSEYKNI
jgi:hypothetical protein